MKKVVSSATRVLGFIVTICSMCFIEGVSGYSRGAPYSTCFTRYPKHNHSPTQTEDNPYTIELSQSSYVVGETVEVKISSSDPDEHPIRGFQIAAFVENPKYEHMTIVGQFSDVDDGKSKIFSCASFAGSVRNMVTHKNNRIVSSVNLTWTAPAENVGNITFLATVVKNFATFWINTKVTLYGSVDLITDYPVESAAGMNEAEDTDFSNCGDTKACFLYPRNCYDNDCVAAVSFEYKAENDSYQVEMQAKLGSGSGYVGVGFSEDDIMGHDETFVCAANTQELSVQHGYSPAKYNERIITNDLSDKFVKIVGGRLLCRFMLRHKSLVTLMKQASNTNDYPQQYNFTFSKNDAWRIQLAWGPIMPDSNVITRHKDMPATTSSSVRIKEIGIYRGTAFHVLVQVHAAMMIVAWTFLTGIVTVIARHYKDMMSRKRLFGTKIWFQVHRALAILVAIMTAIGLITIFTHYGSTIRKAAVPHAYWGLAVTVAVGLQIIAGMLRPDADHKLRIVFNWGHWFLGQASHVMAAVTMFLAFEIDYITEDMHYFGFTTLAIWVGVQLMWHICFEIVSFIMKRTESDSYQVDESKEKSGSWIPAVLLIIYVIFLAACCTSVLCAFLLF
ncbi:hypothetical protein RRG08_024047 [Elysia crispata]|uniref:Ferric-chelate reductase 1 n=1 Tax=Elysia crispata TaxID=231223 RepID=A0AAE1DJK2_9GAST|nr:hypothetical protein RRG08_024047 [Elysia crispata]